MLFVSAFLYGQVFTDTQGRKVNIEKTNKIVALGPGTLRVLTYLGLQDKLVGIEKFELKFDIKSPYRAVLDKKRIKKLPIVSQGGPNKMPNLETLIKVKPDILFTSFFSKEQVELTQSKTKIPVIVLSYGVSYGGGKNESKLNAIKKSLKLVEDIFENSCYIKKIS